MIDRLEEAIGELRLIGQRKAETEWTYRKAKARALVTVKGPNAEHREAAAILHQVSPGVTVADLGYERDLAEVGYNTQRSVIRALQTEAELMRTMIVSARGEGQ
jgi:hypothetical protein